VYLSTLKLLVEIAVSDLFVGLDWRIRLPCSWQSFLLSHYPVSFVTRLCCRSKLVSVQLAARHLGMKGMQTGRGSAET